MFSHKLLGLFLLAGVVALGGCQLFGLDDREFEINLPEIPIGPVQFKGSLIAQDICPDAEAIAGMEGSITRPIVQGIATDLNETADLEQYRGQITGVTVRNITYSIALNTLEKKLEKIDIYFGPESVAADPLDLDLDTAKSAGAVLFGSTREIPGGTTTGGEQVPVDQNPDSLDDVRRYLSAFVFSTLFATSITLEPDDCADLGGDLELEARIAITFFIQPF